MLRLVGTARGLRVGRESRGLAAANSLRSFTRSAQPKSCLIGAACSSKGILPGNLCRVSSYPPKSRRYGTNYSPEVEGRRSKIIKSAKILSLVLAFSVLGGVQYSLVFRHLEKVPQTGRWRKMNITPEQESQLGEDAYYSIISQKRDAILPEFHPITRHVREIVSAILQANDLGHVTTADDPQGSWLTASGNSKRWRLAVVLDENIPNSTASGGGIVVFTGLLSICKDDDELAAILGHEIAHVVARHLAERYSKAKDWSLKQLLLGHPAYRDPRQVEEEYKQMMATNLHEQELEADAIGLELAARACFDPKAAINVNERLVKVEERFRSLHPGFRPAHPRSRERIEKLEHLLPRAYEITSKNPRCS